MGFCPNCKMYLSELQNVFVQIAKCICPNFKMYLSKLRLRGWFSVDRGGLIGVSLAKSQVASHLKPNSIPSQKHTQDQTRPYISKAEGLSRISFTILYQQRLQGKYPTFALGKIASRYNIKIKQSLQGKHQTTKTEHSFQVEI